jgi:hypothetical protein
LSSFLRLLPLTRAALRYFPPPHVCAIAPCLILCTVSRSKVHFSLPAAPLFAERSSPHCSQLHRRVAIAESSGAPPCAVTPTHQVAAAPSSPCRCPPRAPTRRRTFAALPCAAPDRYPELQRSELPPQATAAMSTSSRSRRVRSTTKLWLTPRRRSPRPSTTQRGAEAPGVVVVVASPPGEPPSSPTHQAS